MKLLPGFATFDDVFENMFSDPFFKGTSTHMRTDVKEVDDNYVLDMELPGFDKKDISIELKDGYLILQLINLLMERKLIIKEISFVKNVLLVLVQEVSTLGMKLNKKISELVMIIVS